MSDKPVRQEKQDASEEVTEVAPGVLRLQLPISLPGLGHVNCYAIEDERGFALVDPGLPGEESWKALQKRLDDAGIPLQRVHTAVVTHSHHDHFGGVGRLREEANVDMLSHELFASRFDPTEADDEGSVWDLADDDEWLRRVEARFQGKTAWGTDRWQPSRDELLEFKKLGRAFGRFVATPDPSITVSDSQMVRLGRRDWIAVHTPGHTEDHLCLFDPENGVMLSGDHILPTITPHIGGASTQADPLAAFFASLDRMHDFENVSVVLPAHGHPFADLGGRADEIKVHHEERLDILREAGEQIGEGTVTDYMQRLFRERSWGEMAESETYAHLLHLEILGDATVRNDHGLLHFAPAD